MSNNEEDKSQGYYDERLLREIIARLTALEVNLANTNFRIGNIEKNSDELNRNIQELKANHHQTLGAIGLINWLAVAIVTLTAGIGGYFLSNQVTEVKKDFNNNAPEQTK
jgi:hypothetical protein